MVNGVIWIVERIDLNRVCIHYQQNACFLNSDCKLYALCYLPFYTLFNFSYFRLMKEIVVSGIRSTGNLHLEIILSGEEFHPDAAWIHLFLFIADYHSLTTHPTPADLHSNVKQVLVEYLACRTGSEVSTLYVQSDLPEIAELYLLLNMNVCRRT